MRPRMLTSASKAGNSDRTAKYVSPAARSVHWSVVKLRIVRLRMKPHGSRNVDTLRCSSMRRNAIARSLPTPPRSAGTPAPPHQERGDPGGGTGECEEHPDEERGMRPDLHADVEGREEVVE